MGKLLPLKFHKVHIIVGSWYLIHEKDLRRKCCIHDGYIHHPSPSLFEHKQPAYRPVGPQLQIFGLITLPLVINHALLG